jgi:hypothetical protein
MYKMNPSQVAFKFYVLCFLNQQNIRNSKFMFVTLVRGTLQYRTSGLKLSPLITTGSVLAVNA